ncbi:uncharacterized protein BKA78DRAFT_123535 [Phyllosticta capitalensis]|uniref:uncharacterized protein n=1 Tax=Phyllosticta capitalensis TaxID=121624 RepID=UPI00312E27C0
MSWVSWVSWVSCIISSCLHIFLGDGRWMGRLFEMGGVALEGHGIASIIECGTKDYLTVVCRTTRYLKKASFYPVSRSPRSSLSTFHIGKPSALPPPLFPHVKQEDEQAKAKMARNLILSLRFHDLQFASEARVRMRALRCSSSALDLVCEKRTDGQTS